MEILLVAHARSHKLLVRPDQGDPSATAPHAPAPSFVGTVIAGRYKLLEQVGDGGMGTVWIAEQRQTVKPLVAVKLIKAGMDSKAVLARFEAERQALGLMDARTSPRFSTAAPHKATPAASAPEDPTVRPTAELIRPRSTQHGVSWIGTAHSGIIATSTTLRKDETRGQ